MGKPKFRVGQVVAPRLQGQTEWVGNYFKIVAIEANLHDKFIYLTSQTSPEGPWIGEKSVRPLTSREAGRGRRKK